MRRGEAKRGNRVPRRLWEVELECLPSASAASSCATSRDKRAAAAICVDGDNLIIIIIELALERALSERVARDIFRGFVLGNAS